jgi:uncharacterized repeat protein (TIGR03803 family)
MYGCALAGGPNGSSVGGAGMLFEITKSGAYVDRYDFETGADGARPTAVAIDAHGNLYGTAQQGGKVHNLILAGEGMVWKLTPSGTFTNLHNFGSTITNANGRPGPDGFLPQAGVVLDSAGDVFGTTMWGGPNWSSTNQYGGIVWEITAAGQYRDLHDFGGRVTDSDGATGPDGDNPYAGVTLDKGGNLYGATYDGGAHGVDFYGMVWMLNVATLRGVAIAPTEVTGDSTAVGTVTLSVDAPLGGLRVALKSSSSSAAVPSTILVLAGETTAAFTVKTTPVAVKTTVTVTATFLGVAKTASLTIEPPALTSLSLSPSTVTGGASSVGTVMLTGIAPTAGTHVELSSNSKTATLPASVTVAAGKSSATFTVKTSNVSAQTSATISAKLGSVTKTAVLTISP